MNLRGLYHLIRTFASAVITAVVFNGASAESLLAQGGRPAPLPSIEERTTDMRRLDGYFPLYWDSTAARLYMEIPRLNAEVLNIIGLASGLGSNDIGLDRGQLQQQRVVFFERSGPRVMMVQPNFSYRSSSNNPAEVRAVRDAFARSVVWSFNVIAESGAGSRILVELNDYLLRDATNMSGQLSPGSYRLEVPRSGIYMPMTMNFPLNTEMEVELTFVSQPGAAAGGRAAGAFEGVGSVAATSEAASMRVHHSFVQLPDNNYTPRLYDPRSGFFAMSYEDYSVPLGDQMTQRFIRRHRLEKRDPNAAVSEAVTPIIYYLDPGTPEPVRTALLEGGRWWNEAFEAAGFRNAFRVEMLPEGASSHDIRYNVINWVHRSTRGWSYGASVSDPRTGEIIKGVVTLGSLRVRHDWMLLEGLLQPYANGDERPEEIERWSLQRLRQLSAHEIGHTIGLGHNFYSSGAGRISVMDYPHPLINLRPNGTMDLSEAYTNSIGEWDKVAINYGYRQFAAGTDERVALAGILDAAWANDLRYLTNQDLGGHARVDQWSNGTDPAVELNRMMAVRRVALSRFGENAIKRGTPMAQLEDVLVPLYMHHRFQVDAALGAVGGLHYIYALRGDGREPMRMASAAEQRAALSSLLGVLRPSELVLPTSILRSIPPRPSGFGRTRELFPRNTGPLFDAITPGVIASGQVVSGLLGYERSTRLLEQQMLDPSLPGLAEVIDSIVGVSFGGSAQGAYQEEMQRAVQRVVVDALVDLAAGAAMSQVRAIATLKLRELHTRADALSMARQNDVGVVAHTAALRDDITRFLERPIAPAPQRFALPSAPPGAPIGSIPQEWLHLLDPDCIYLPLHNH